MSGGAGAGVEVVVDAAWGRARAAVLGRLWGALLREPVPGAAVAADGVRWRDGRLLRGPAWRPFDEAPAGMRLWLAGREYADPAELAAALPVPGAARLAAELADSVRNLASAYLHAPPPAALGRLAALPAAEAAVLAEQSVIAGHPLHPGCRTRLPMTAAQVRAYGPEHRPVVPVRWWRVPDGRWWSPSGAPPLLALHPWQARRVAAHCPGLRPGARVDAARPLMSLRTVAVDALTHLKLSVDVQMTSAVRRVSAAAVRNGPVLGALVAALAPGLVVLGEYGGGAVLVEGEPSGSWAMLRRRAPLARPGEVVVPLAALAVSGPAGPLAVQAARAGYGGDLVGFLDALAAVLLPPVVAALAGGVALEAHGQNTLVALAGGRPVRVYYRDFGGVRVAPRRLAAAGVPAGPLAGDVVCADPRELRTTVAAAVGVVVGEVVAVLERAGGDPAACWAAVSRRLAAAFAAAGDRWGDEAALRAEPVPVKATTAMRLADAPLVNQWAWLPFGWDGR